MIPFPFRQRAPSTPGNPADGGGHQAAAVVFPDVDVAATAAHHRPAGRIVDMRATDAKRSIF
jgi:hypothetical protein